MWHATCELCRQSFFSPTGVVAFTLKDKALVKVDLGTREPWSGVRIACNKCIKDINIFMNEQSNQVKIGYP